MLKYYARPGAECFAQRPVRGRASRGTTEDLFWFPSGTGRSLPKFEVQDSAPRSPSLPPLSPAVRDPSDFDVLSVEQSLPVRKLLHPADPCFELHVRTCSVSTDTPVRTEELSTRPEPHVRK